MSVGIHQVCRTKNETEISAITITSTANNLPIIYLPRCAAITTNESSSICTPPLTQGVRPPETLARPAQYGVAVKTKFAVAAPAPTVTSCVFVPYCSCHAVTVYLQAGNPVMVKLPSSPVTA